MTTNLRAEMVNPNRFYTYAYLREDRTPYYIGKGSSGRIYQKSNNEIKPPKDKKRVIFLKKNITEEEAFRHEEYMIFIFGRKDLGTGILRNKTKGGEGVSGYIFTETQRLAVIKSNKKRKGWKQTEKSKNILREINRGKKLSEKTKKLLSDKAKLRVGWKHSEETKMKISKSNCKYIYELESPDGKTFTTYNLTGFCRENPQYGLYRRLLCDVANGKQRHHKGWTVRILEHLT